MAGGELCHCKAHAGNRWALGREVGPLSVGGGAGLCSTGGRLGLGLGGLVHQEAQLFLRDAPEVRSEDPRLRAPLRLPAGTPHFPGVPCINVSELPPAVSSLAWAPASRPPGLTRTAVSLGWDIEPAGHGAGDSRTLSPRPSPCPAPSVHPLCSLREALSSRARI